MDRHDNHLIFRHSKIITFDSKHFIPFNLQSTEKRNQIQTDSNINNARNIILKVSLPGVNIERYIFTKNAKVFNWKTLFIRDTSYRTTKATRFGLVDWNFAILILSGPKPLPTYLSN